PFKPDPNSAERLHRQIYTFLRRAILNGDLPPGSRLPSSRALARSLGVSRNTVLNAYEALSAEGLLTGKIGSGARVLKRPVGDSFHLKLPDPRRFLRESHYPSDASLIRDPDGTPIYIHR